MREHDSSFGPATMRRGRRKFDDDEADFLKRGKLEPALAEEPDLLYDGTCDWLHQGYREPAMPRSYELMKQLRGAGFAAVISGAGPSVLVLGRTEDLAALAS